MIGTVSIDTSKYPSPREHPVIYSIQQYNRVYKEPIT